VNRLLCLFLLSSCAALADAGPQSGACERALAALQARESELAAARAGGVAPRVAADARWQALRRVAARDCLGHAGTAAPAASAPLPHSALPPIAVPPVAVPPAPTLPAAPPEAAQRRAPPLPGSRPPPFVTSCDALGCWTSEGARLPHTGRNPLNARVRCSLQGQIVVCL
jgi:hypothetical protein